MTTTSSIESKLPPPGDADSYELIIRPTKNGSLDWRELWHYRELLALLVWRDLKVRYKQTVLGVAWAVIQPVFSMLVFTVIFGNLAKLNADGFPYAVFVYAGLLPWTFFSTSVTSSSQSLMNQSALLTKVYFPRLFIPASSLGTGLVDMAISFIVYALILAYYHFVPSWQIVFLPFLLLMTIAAAFAMGLFLASVTVTYRDFRYVVPFLMQAMMYLSPVVYSSNLIPERYQWIAAFNPMFGLIDAYRSSILGKPWNLPNLGISFVVIIAMLMFSLSYFRRTERRFADIA
jgi:lipopolysaccharide transport system permease protein